MATAARACAVVRGIQVSSRAGWDDRVAVERRVRGEVVHLDVVHVDAALHARCLVNVADILGGKKKRKELTQELKYILRS